LNNLNPMSFDTVLAMAGVLLGVVAALAVFVRRSETLTEMADWMS